MKKNYHPEKTMDQTRSDEARETAKLEREWLKIEAAFKYLAKTSKPGMGWREALGRPYEPNT